MINLHVEGQGNFPIVDEVRETAYRRRGRVEEAAAVALPIHVMPPPEGAFRRRIFAEIVRIETLLASSTLQDEMTQTIRNDWFEPFKETMKLNRLDPQAVFNEFVPLLQNILIDPIYGAPLDKKARLGSDGHTYGRMTLSVFLADIPEEERRRIPVDFTTESHPIVKQMVKWLISHDRLLHDHEKEAAYRELVAQGRRPIIPTRESEEIRIQRERHLRRMEQRQQRRAGRNEHIDRLRIQRNRDIDERFGDIRNQIGHINQMNQQRQAFLEERGQGILENFEHEVQQIENENIELQQRVNDFHIEIPAHQDEERLEAFQERVNVQRIRREERLEALNLELDRLRNENAEAIHQIEEHENEVIEDVEEEIAALREHDEERAQAGREQVEAFEERLGQIQAINGERAQVELNAIQRQNQENGQRNLERLEAVQRNDQENYRVQQGEIAQINAGIHQAEIETVRLQKKAWKVEKEILKAKEENLKLQIAIEKTKKAIKKRNNGWVKGAILIGGMVASGLISWQVTTLLSSALPGAQGTVSLLPGVAKIGGSLIL